MFSMRSALVLHFVGLVTSGALAQTNVREPVLEGALIRDDWAVAELGRLENHVQLTTAEQFSRAGESYFSPDGKHIVFQATEAGAQGKDAELYGMYLGDVRYDEHGRIVGVGNVRRISPPGSHNTCGWFHPTEPAVIFGSTISSPTSDDAPGYQRGSDRYKWMFPPQMNIVRCELSEADGTHESISVLLENDDAYLAECSFSPDGRHLLYCSLESGAGDLYVKDMQTGKTAALVTAAGYDGGPFFSPDGQRICYRSDRRNDNLLQLFVADLQFADDGRIIGIEREYQLTDNGLVNWAPFWHPSGRYLVYTTSEMGHRNYEIFVVAADPGTLPDSPGPIRYGVGHTRLTEAAGFDGLPVFDATGRHMMWTSQRDESSTSQLWVADFVFDLNQLGQTPEAPAPTESPVAADAPPPTEVQVRDPQSGNVFIYDTREHTLYLYDMQTHRKTEVNDPAQLQRFMKLLEEQRIQENSGSAH